MKILACGEFTQLSSGYAIYMREILDRLRQLPEVEIAEMACYCHPDDHRLNGIPWKVYPVAPSRNNQKEVDEYNSSPMNAFGAAKFNEVLLSYKPTHVIDIRDSWHLEYQFRSPLRKYFAHVVMPAVDAIPQHKTWIDMYASADKLLSYTNWGIDVLKEAGLKNTHHAASPCAGEAYQQSTVKDKLTLKRSLGLGDIKIIGTVMRNQRRKLFPNLFADFAKFLRDSGRKDIYLLCHTSNPDTWELDELLLEHGIQHRVLFSYSCGGCKSVDVSFYKGLTSSCHKCNKMTLNFSSTQNGISNKSLSNLYNMMDLYVQYSVCEGYGMPLGEAVSCGVPIMAVDYSAMSEIINDAQGIPIKVAALYKEAESGRMMAAPDGEDFIDKLKKFFSMSDDEISDAGDFSKMLYGLRSYDRTADIWYDALKSVSPKRSWDAEGINLNTMPPRISQDASNSEFARYLISQVLQEPERLGSLMEARLIRDISSGHAYRGFDGKFFHEDFSGRGVSLVEFSREKAFTHFSSLLADKIHWEKRRISSL